MFVHSVKLADAGSINDLRRRPKLASSTMKLQSLVSAALALSTLVAGAVSTPPVAVTTLSKANGFLALGGKPVKTNNFKKSFTSDSQTQPSKKSTNTTSSIPTDGGAQTHDKRPDLQNGGVNLHPYTAEIKSYILHAHNKARASLVPTEAANMRKLTWDESLAIEASELVETCVFKHDTEGYQYGQNLIYGGTKLDKASVDEWMVNWVMDEISDNDRSAKGFMDLDHATAVLWATTHLVGCASKFCPQGQFTACNYYSPGNWMGARTYIQGKSCSQCPEEAPYCDKETGKLCVADPHSTESVAATTTPSNAKVPDSTKLTDSSPAASPPRPAARPAHKLCH